MKKLKKIWNSFGWSTTVIFRKATGIKTEMKIKVSDNTSVEHVIYNNSSDLSTEDLMALESIAKGAATNLLKWLDKKRCRLYAIKLDGELAHYCLVMICKKGDSYRMAKKDDLSITPCSTSEKHRRKGLYKVNLEYICSEWRASKWAYGYTRPENIISQKGIESCGFERVGVYKYFRIGRFTMCITRIGD